VSRRTDALALVLAVAVAVGCVFLGRWQLSRLRERRALNDGIRARGELPVVTLTGSESFDSMQWRRVRAVGVYDYRDERVWTGRTLEGTPGVALLTPLRVTGGGVVLVDRGWVPSPDASHIDGAQWREGDSVEVAGLAVPLPGSPPSFAVEDTIPPKGRAAGAGPWRWPPPELSEGPHLSYAIQWFSFAVIILVGSTVLYVKRGRDGRTHGDTSI